MGPLGFFDIETRYRGLDAKGDPLAAKFSSLYGSARSIPRTSAPMSCVSGWISNQGGSNDQFR